MPTDHIPRRKLPCGGPQLHSLAKWVLDLRSAGPAGTDPMVTAQFDALVAYVRDALIENGVRIEEPEVARALMTIQAIADNYRRASMVTLAAEQAAVTAALNAVAAGAVAAADRHVAHLEGGAGG